MGKKEIESILLINWYYVGYKLHKPKSVNAKFIGRYLNNRINREHKSLNFLKINNILTILSMVLIRFRF
jgi:hypothetical protein